MRRNNTKLYAVFALLIAIGGLSIGLSALSTSLNITGGAEVINTVWNIVFRPLSNSNDNIKNHGRNNIYHNIHTAEPHFQDVQFTQTAIEGFGGTLKTPGDELFFVFDIINLGDYQAVLDSVTPYEISFYDTSQSDIDKVTPYLDLSLTYAIKDEDAPATNSSYRSGEPLQIGTILDSNQSIRVILSIKYDKNNELSSTDQLPDGEIEIDDVGYEIIFRQPEY